jgi:quinolinate synthase
MTQPIDYPATVPAMYEFLQRRLHDTVPAPELRLKAEIAVDVNRLKREKNAIILGHNYMEPALFQAVPDFTGDSLGLCRIAARTQADIIVFCGVQFMAETAKVLNPERKVLIPSDRAGCSLASSITAEDVRALRRAYPEAVVVAYVNTYADVKAEIDYCCTSGNATDMVRYLAEAGHREILFLPDEYLARNTAAEAGFRFHLSERSPEGPVQSGSLRDAGGGPVVIGWPGRCEVHEQFTPADIQAARAQFPDVAILAHPECSPEVVEEADYSGSTTQMVAFVEKTQKRRYLLLTECSMGENIAASNPDKDMVRMCSVRCPHMNQITLEQTLASLELERYEVDVPEDIRRRAVSSLDRMLAIGGKSSRALGAPPAPQSP